MSVLRPGNEELMGDTVLDEAIAGPSDESAAEPASRWSSERVFWVNAACLAVVLLALVPLFNDGSSFISDEGLYAAQARNLAEGSWASERNALDVDPLGRLDVLYSEAVVGDQRIPYSRHPIYPLILSVFYRLGGAGALILPSVIGTWVAAVVGARIARRIEPRLTLPSLWLLGVASPLLYNAYVIMGHSLAAGASAVMLLGLVKAIDDRDRLAVVWMVVAAAALLALRSEGLIVALAVVGTAALSALRIRPRWSIDWFRATVAAVLLATVVVAYYVEAAAGRAIVGSDHVGSAGIDRKSDLAAATWASLLRPWSGNETVTSSAALLTMLLIALAALALRFRPATRLLPIAFLLVAAVTAVVRQFESKVLISGLLPAFPLLLGGLLLVPARSLRRLPVAVLLGAVALTTPVLLVTMYGDGGSVQWGGRFFAVLLPALVPLAALGLARGHDLLPVSERRVVGPALLVVAVSLSLVCMRTLYLRSAQSNVVDATMEAAASYGSRPALIVVSPLVGNGTSRMFWREAADGAPMVSLRNPGQLRRLAPLAEEVGYPGIVVLSNRSAEITRAVAGEELETMGWAILSEEPQEGGSWRVIRLGPVAAEGPGPAEGEGP